MRIKEFMLGMQSIIDAKDNNLVLVNGLTGEGSSTLIEYMSGQQLQGTPTDLDEDELQIDILHKEQTRTKIGHTLHSETLYPIIAQDNDFIYCDCPALSIGPYNYEGRTHPEISFRFAAAMAKNISFMFTLSIPCMGQRSMFKLYQEFLDQISVLFSFDGSPIEKSILVVGTKRDLSGVKENFAFSPYLQRTIKAFSKYGDSHQQGFREHFSHAQTVLMNVLDEGASRDEAKKYLKALTLLNPDQLNLNINDDARKDFECDFFRFLTLTNIEFEDTKKNPESIPLLKNTFAICSLMQKGARLEAHHPELSTLIEKYMEHYLSMTVTETLRFSIPRNASEEKDKNKASFAIDGL